MVSVNGVEFLSMTAYARLVGWVADQKLQAPALVDLLGGDHGRGRAVARELRGLRRRRPPEPIRAVIDDGIVKLPS